MTTKKATLPKAVSPKNPKKTTITREMFIEKTAAVYKVVEIPEWGWVGIKTIKETTRTRRSMDEFDSEGKHIPAVADLRRIYRLIDQVFMDEDTPMFQESDIGWMKETNSHKMDALNLAVMTFNEEFDDMPGEPDESSDAKED